MSIRTSVTRLPGGSYIQLALDDADAVVKVSRDGVAWFEAARMNIWTWQTTTAKDYVEPVTPSRPTK